MSKHTCKIGSEFYLLDEIEFGNGGPDTYLIEPGTLVICVEVRDNDILLESEYASFYLDKSDIEETLEFIKDQS